MRANFIFSNFLESSSASEFRNTTSNFDSIDAIQDNIPTANTLWQHKN